MSSAEKNSLRKKSQFSIVWNNLKRNKAAVLGLSIFSVLIFIAAFAELIAPYDYAKIDVMNAFLPPSAEHPCGTDQTGRDVLSRLMVGARYSLTLGLLATLMGTAIGLVFGSISGYFGGIVDEVIMRITDVFQSIPGMVLNVAVACAIGTGFWKSIFVLAITNVSGAARMIRAQILAIKSVEYVEAASVTNCSTVKIICKHLIPNCIAPTIVNITMGIGGNIMAAAGLAYLGLGVKPPAPEWGAMLADSRNYLMKYPWLCVFPGLLIMITVLSLNLFGDGLRDALDPKLKK